MDVPDPPESDDEFAAECCRLHNQLRRAHGCSPLTLTAQLCALAADRAAHCAQLRHVLYDDEHDGTYGENITFFPWTFTAESCMSFWLEEEKRFDYSKRHWQQGTNYFTQMVWKSSRELGIGRAFMQEGKDGKHQAVVVALYSPPGNTNKPGHFAANVLPPHKETLYEGSPVDGAAAAARETNVDQRDFEPAETPPTQNGVLSIG